MYSRVVDSHVHGVCMCLFVCLHVYACGHVPVCLCLCVCVCVCVHVRIFCCLHAAAREGYRDDFYMTHDPMAYIGSEAAASHAAASMHIPVGMFAPPAPPQAQQHSYFQVGVRRLFTTQVLKVIRGAFFCSAPIYGRSYIVLLRILAIPYYSQRA